MSQVFNVNAFKAAMVNGGARPNQFAVGLTFPQFVNAPTATLTAPLLVSAAALPGQIVPPATVMYRGREVKFVGDRQFAPWTITVLNDSNFVIRDALEQWMRGMEDYADKFGFLNPVDYQSDLFVQQLDRNGNSLREYQLVSAFPTEISDVSLDFGANDQISTFTATFVYQHFTQ